MRKQNGKSYRINYTVIPVEDSDR